MKRAFIPAHFSSAHVPELKPAQRKRICKGEKERSAQRRLIKNTEGTTTHKNHPTWYPNQIVSRGDKGNWFLGLGGDYTINLTGGLCK